MPDATSRGVALRRFPAPYRAMLAIASDLDETPDRHLYWEIARFLNTAEPTAMGPGVNLEVGNTIYFDMAPDQFAYWNTDEAGREMVRAMIKSGHIDCIHSFGDLATTRRHAARALEELDRHGCRLVVWIDHAVAPTNFGADIMRGRGDVPGADVYHADLTCAFGVRYVWRGRVTSVIGQDAPRSLGAIARAAHPVRSAVTLAKEFAKGTYARLGHEKYAMHGPNRVLRPATLRDGQPVLEFLRSNPYWGGVQLAATAAGIADVLTESMLRRLAVREGVCVLYTHLGKVTDHRVPFGEATRAAFARLAEAQRRGEILVATTRRTLDYCRLRDETTFRATGGEGALVIDAVTPPDIDPAGLTFAVPAGVPVRLTVNGRPVGHLDETPADATHPRSVGVPWRRLAFPEW